MGQLDQRGLEWVRWIRVGQGGSEWVRVGQGRSEWVRVGQGGSERVRVGQVDWSGSERAGIGSE